jgi:putative ABC transport system substrate-binding protein
VLCFFALSLLVKAQRVKKIPRIGYLHSGPAATPPASLEAFRQGLRDLGYIKGKTIAIEYRFAEYKPEASLN